MIGLTGGSLALVAFGVVGILDCTASVALVAHFRGARSGGTSENLERLALRVVTGGLMMVGLTTVLISLLHLFRREETTSSVSGILLAGGSLIALGVLSLRKRYISVRLPSHALLADSHLSAVGAVLAAVTLSGTAASNSFGCWWADPAAALAIAVAAIGLGFMLRHEP